MFHISCKTVTEVSSGVKNDRDFEVKCNSLCIFVMENKKMRSNLRRPHEVVKGLF